jgi:hypothetical protein
MKTTGAKDITKICGFLFALSVSSSCGKADYRALSSGQQANNNVPGDSNPPPTAPPPPTEDPERFHTKGSGGQKGNTNQTCQGEGPLDCLFLSLMLQRMRALLW